jgi:hypothetical protein
LGFRAAIESKLATASVPRSGLTLSRWDFNEPLDEGAMRREQLVTDRAVPG